MLCSKLHVHFRFNALTFGKCLQQKAAEHVTLRNCITVPQVKIKLKKRIMRVLFGCSGYYLHKNVGGISLLRLINFFHKTVLAARWNYDLQLDRWQVFICWIADSHNLNLFMTPCLNSLNVPSGWILIVADKPYAEMRIIIL